VRQSRRCSGVLQPCGHAAGGWVATVKLQFEVRPQTNVMAGAYVSCGVSETMRKSTNGLVQALLALRSRLARYRPEKHYMRGPGPKTLSKLGDAYRTQTESELSERVPDAWLALIQSIRERERQG
jgi:hypothetical protein